MAGGVRGPRCQEGEGECKTAGEGSFQGWAPEVMDQPNLIRADFGVSLPNKSVTAAAPPSAKSTDSHAIDGRFTLPASALTL